MSRTPNEAEMENVNRLWIQCNYQDIVHNITPLLNFPCTEIIDYSQIHLIK